MDTTNSDTIKKYNEENTIKKQKSVPQATKPDPNRTETSPPSKGYMTGTIIPSIQGPIKPPDAIAPPPPPAGTPGDKYNIDKQNAQKIKSDKENIIAQKAMQTQDAIAAQDAKAKRERQQLLDKQEKETRHTAQHVGTATEGLSESIADTTSPYLTWFSRVQTPGGILTMVLILLFFLFAVTPVNKSGDTRLKLLWLTLTGKTSLDYGNQNPNTSSADPNSGGGGGGTFGNTPPSSPSSNGNMLPPIDIGSMNFLDFLSSGF